MRHPQLAALVTLFIFSAACSFAPFMRGASPDAGGEALTLPAKTPITLTLSGMQFHLPAGWKVTQKTANRIDLVSDDDKASITIDCAQKKKKISEQDFKSLTDAQIAKEGKNSPGGKVHSVPPHIERVYYGGPRKSGRVFAGYMRAVNQNFVLVVGELDEKDKNPKKAMKMVSDFIQGLFQP